MSDWENVEPTRFVPKAATPVLIVSPTVRVVVRDDLPPGQMFVLDGETYWVNGERPYSAHD